MGKKINMNKNISDPEVYVLGCTGRSGINFFHSRLDGHPEILIMPDLSFFRSIYGYKNSKFYNEKYQENKKKFSIGFINYLYASRKNDLEKEFLFSTKEKKKFIKKFNKIFMSRNDNSFYKKLFFSLHYAYASLKNLNNKKKIIIAHEHSSIFFDNYFSILKNPKFIILVRNPINIFAGLKYLNLFKYKYHAPISFDFHLGQILFAAKFLKKNKSIIVKNEIMNRNTTFFFKNFIKKIGLRYHKNLEKNTYLNKKWIGDASYLLTSSNTNNYQTTKTTPKNFHLKKNQLERSLKQLDNKEVTMIETLLHSVYKQFNYKLLIKKNFFKNLKGYFYFFTIYNQRQKIKNNAIQYIKCIVRRLLILLKFKKIYFWLNIT